ncbi:MULTISPECIES: PIG-L deacetylase family protein [unclassified Tolypothrix]|uniref:PIG-L deacetylase family protein n=1 Tax=unclassified Tolypothrix TaxID=2649714 RepID=UPI0005EABAA9|nr:MULTISPECIES: PIG-L family deacetylase [unclassified Tolypothrix]BAY92220.1 LmbE-like protein [Microchaete diplosiphon NIES-3275]EKE98604.1 N-acetylglucosaminyl phosphatidylinositol [Tolypothrix sp. PCC 7601]MBE9086370.1 PIG-L family deacetylase [Tolypothrix sp. LEGE 11397]UYD26194.1 PIG-L family deacetylase [Tolypothrix sp. PCC 7712]UYD31569.1 PIG-L family deacetylase [Tolypothrix sp. PCC 7601]
MSIKIYLQRLQKLIPHTWLEQIQDIHSSLLFRWIVRKGSQPIAFTQKSAMVFSPHQDDETFGCGGMIALKREHNIPVVVAFLTDGQGAGTSEVNTPNKIIQIRKQEAVNALEILGVKSSEIHFLEKPDGTLPYLDERERAQTITQVAALLKQYQPEEVYVPHRKDCHRDHEATYQLVKAAIAQAGITVDLLQYPIWLFWRAPLFILLKLQDIAAAYYLPIASVQDKKTQAISSYCSQIESLPRGFIQRFSGSHEIFFKSES